MDWGYKLRIKYARSVMARACSVCPRQLNKQPSIHYTSKSTTITQNQYLSNP